MSWLDLEQSTEAEEIDNPDQPYDEIARSMGDVAAANRLFWGIRPIVKHVQLLLSDAPTGTRIRILDIATGSGDIPRALIRWGNRRGLQIIVVGVDNLWPMLQMARSMKEPLALVQADALHLPFAPGSFDIALCALAFHHFGFADSVAVLRAMDSLATRGFIVSDLRRDRIALAAVRIGMGLIRPHPFTQHDAPISVRRAFTPRECEKMIALSGVQNARIYSHGYVRLLLAQDKRGKIVQSG